MPAVLAKLGVCVCVCVCVSVSVCVCLWGCVCVGVSVWVGVRCGAVRACVRACVCGTRNEEQEIHQEREYKLYNKRSIGYCTYVKIEIL